MQNQIYPQYNMPQQYNAYAQPQGVSPSVGAVNIQIFNPTASPAQGFYQQNACAPYPCNYNNMINQTPVYTQPVNQQPVNQMPQASTNVPQTQPMLDTNNTMNLDKNDKNNVAAKSDGDKGTKTEEKKDEKNPKVALTDDYIKTLENYLNSQDKKIRLMGAKELFERFKEDETRKDDAALTALLNKTLQDPAETVKFMAMTALDLGYATGNDETVQILTGMQNSDSSYGEDAALASQILLKMSGAKANADTEAAKNAANMNSSANMNALPDDNNGGILMNNSDIAPKAEGAPVV